jgi:hypothetical protein
MKGNRMDFRVGWQSIWMVVVLANVHSGSAGVAWAEGRYEVEVFVYNDAGASVPVLKSGEAEATRILYLAGVRLTWRNCFPPGSSEQPSCRLTAGTPPFVLRVLPRARASSDLVFGEAFLDDTGSGKYADIFFERIEAAHDQYGANVPQLAGAVIAHELGHLLLGFRAHSRIGIMMPVWERECLHRLSVGGLLFTTDQVKRMQARLEQSSNSKFATNLAKGSQLSHALTDPSFVSLKRHRAAIDLH